LEGYLEEDDLLGVFVLVWVTFWIERKGVIVMEWKWMKSERRGKGGDDKTHLALILGPLLQEQLKRLELMPHALNLI
jgi:hypothetical protein